MFTPIPTQFIGPLFIKAETWQSEDLKVPLATYETTLWPSTQRGAKMSRLCQGIQVTTLKNCMTRSLYFSTTSARQAHLIAEQINLESLQKVVSSTSQFAKLQAIHREIVGTQLYLRFSFFTGDASGHNMTTKAADAIISDLLQRFPELQYGSISANLCVDKKVSSINGILGRGKHVIAEITLPRALCVKHLRTTPEQIQTLNIHKNLMGGILSGGVRSANAHYANLLLASYLATGQDAANIVEGSQGITTAQVTTDGDLYFSVNLPNLIVGTVGNGKHHPDIALHLKNMGCEPDPAHPGKSSERLAEIIAATVLCGELSLMAAQTNQGELTKSHMIFERKK
ncbi:MAG: hydroxymethylglutaryl-CoA reductase [Gammaproteobacteria bacterium]|jgi:hydroxymethylglutaryl-CoA reductase (NADPH)|nr:hydroxymethylglutaryl-CoA reductase [Gammaproteobacteria bacterium]